MKKLVGVLLLAVMLVSMFAMSASAAGPVTIFHHMGEQAKRDALQAWCDAVTAQNPEYTYEITVIADPNEYRSLIKTKIAAGDPVDIMFGAARDYSDMIDAGNIADLTGMPYLAAYDPAILEGFTFDGKVYGIPVDFGLLMVFYNKDIFAEYDLSVPKNYQEFMDICNTLVENGVNPLALGFKDGWTAGVDFMMEWYMILAQEPDMFRDIEAGKTTFADYPAFRRAMERSRERFATATGNPFGTDNDQSIQMFASGRAAMLPNGTWSVATVRDLDPEGNYGLFALPADNEADTRARLFTDDCFMVSSQTERMDAVTALFNFATSAEGANIWAEKTALIPAVKGVTLVNPDEMTADAQAQIDSGKTILADTAYQFTGQLFDIFFGKFSPDFLADDSKDIDTWIAELDAEIAAALRP